MALMHFSFSRTAIRSGERRRREVTEPGHPTIEPGRPAAMGISVQPVHGHHCICERCQRQTPARSA
jgi:hypothetical protein